MPFASQPGVQWKADIDGWLRSYLSWLVPEGNLLRSTTYLDPKPGTHSRLSPSSAHRWLRCPGSVQLCDQVQERQASEYSAEGTVAHEVRETCLLTGADPEEFLGREIEADGFTFTVDEAMVEALRPGIEWVRERKGRLVVEHKVKFDRWLPGQFGTLDTGIIGDHLIIINDLKYGAGMPVSAYENEQLMTYALGFWENVARFETDATEFLLVVDQPRARRSGPAGSQGDFEDEEGDEEKQWGGEWYVSLEDLLAFGERLKTGYDIASSTGAWLRAGEKQCQFCPAKGFCDEYARQALAVLQVEFCDLDPQSITLKAHGQLTPEIRSNVALNQGVVKSWLGAVYAKALSDAKMGRETPYAKAVNGKQGPRKWASEDAAREYMEEHLPSEKVTWEETKMLSPAQFEKQKVSTDAKKGLSNLVTRSEGKPVLVGIGDKRPSINIADEFDDEIDDEFDD